MTASSSYTTGITGKKMARFTTILGSEKNKIDKKCYLHRVVCAPPPPPPNFSLTKSPVLKPAPRRISWNTAPPLATPTPSFDSLFVANKNFKNIPFVYEKYFVMPYISFIVSSSHKTFAIVEENRWLIVESVLGALLLLPQPKTRVLR